MFIPNLLALAMQDLTDSQESIEECQKIVSDLGENLKKKYGFSLDMKPYTEAPTAFNSRILALAFQDLTDPVMSIGDCEEVVAMVDKNLRDKYSFSLDFLPYSEEEKTSK